MCSRTVACSDFSSLFWELDQVYLRPQGDLRLIVSHEDIAVYMLSEQAHLFPNILEVLVKLQVCERTGGMWICCLLKYDMPSLDYF